MSDTPEYTPRRKADRMREYAGWASTGVGGVVLLWIAALDNDIGDIHRAQLEHLPVIKAIEATQAQQVDAIKQIVDRLSGVERENRREIKEIKADIGDIRQLVWNTRRDVETYSHALQVKLPSLSEEEAPAKTMAERVRLVLVAIRDFPTRAERPDMWTANGKPRVDELGARCGLSRITALERDMAYGLYLTEAQLEAAEGP